MSVFIKEAYYHYYHCALPYVAAPAMTAYNLIITINLSRKKDTEQFVSLWPQVLFPRLINT